MDTTETSPVSDPQAMADLEEVCRLIAGGKPVTDPELIRRIEGRAAAAREEALRLFGVRDIGVDIIRAMRDPR